MDEAIWHIKYLWIEYNSWNKPAPESINWVVNPSVNSMMCLGGICRDNQELHANARQYCKT
jgi:hypothetical protein